MKIIPMPIGFGYGFVSDTPDYGEIGYRYEQVDRYHNYYFTPENYYYPGILFNDSKYVFDAFSPNLNKELHVGHLRNLVLANSLSKLFKQSSFVSLLGTSLGIISESLEKLNWWFDFTGYRPKIYFDTLLPKYNIPLSPGENDYLGSKVWEQNKKVVLLRTGGKPTYPYYELLFANHVNPTHYITGNEQIDHFKSLNLKTHLTMGLVLGTDGKKIKSREGEPHLASEALEEVANYFRPTKCDKNQLAWNVIAYNFLSSSRTSNIKWNPKAWTNDESPGMYISYTYARLGKVLNDLQISQEVVNYQKLQQQDVDLIGLSRYYKYYYNKSIENFDPCSLAQFTLRLAKALNRAYESESIKDGREEFGKACFIAFQALEICIKQLGLFCLREI